VDVGEQGEFVDCTEREVRAFGYEAEDMHREPVLQDTDETCVEVEDTGSLLVVGVVAEKGISQALEERTGTRRIHLDYQGH